MGRHVQHAQGHTGLEPSGPQLSTPSLAVTRLDAEDQLMAELYGLGPDQPTAGESLARHTPLRPHVYTPCLQLALAYQATFMDKLGPAEQLPASEVLDLLDCAVR